MDALVEAAVQHWRFVSPLLKRPESEADCDEEHRPMPPAAGVEALHLMQEHGTALNDLPEIGPAAAVSDLLNGVVRIDAQRAAASGGRFALPAAVFLAP